VNESTQRVGTHHAEKPQNQQNCEDRPKHWVLLGGQYSENLPFRMNEFALCDIEAPVRESLGATTLPSAKGDGHLFPFQTSVELPIDQ
jgi:hypothetical protein